MLTDLVTDFRNARDHLAECRQALRESKRLLNRLIDAKRVLDEQGIDYARDEHAIVLSDAQRQSQIHSASVHRAEDAVNQARNTILAWVLVNQ